MRTHRRLGILAACLAGLALMPGRGAAQQTAPQDSMRAADSVLRQAENRLATQQAHDNGGWLELPGWRSKDGWVLPDMDVPSLRELNGTVYVRVKVQWGTEETGTITDIGYAAVDCTMRAARYDLVPSDLDTIEGGATVPDAWWKLAKVHPLARTLVKQICGDGS